VSSVRRGFKVNISFTILFAFPFLPEMEITERKHTRKAAVVTNGATPVLLANSSSQAGPSLQGGSVQAVASSLAVSRNAVSSFQTAGDSPSHVVTTHDTHHDSDSDSHNYALLRD